jgi:hypothetical protein
MHFGTDIKLHTDVLHPALNYPVDGGSALVYYFGTSPRNYKASYSGGQYSYSPA